MSERKGVLERLLETGVRAASQVARAVADSDRARGAAATAVGAAQRGKKRLDEAQERVLHLLGLAARDDYAEVAKRMARLKRKVRDLSRRLEREEGGAPASADAGQRGADGAGPEEGDSGEGGARR